MIIGIFLLIIGVVWLLSNFGVISANVGNFIWPAILIALGIHMLYHHRDRSWWIRGRDKDNK